MDNTPPRKILVVEDEKPFARALELKLIRVGYQVEVASDGEQALARVYHDGYDLMLLDLMMPGMDGFSVLTQMKEQGIKTPVMVISQLAQPEDIKRVKELGVIKYFVKFETPLSSIVEEVKKILAKQST